MAIYGNTFLDMNQSEYHANTVAYKHSSSNMIYYKTFLKCLALIGQSRYSFK